MRQLIAVLGVTVLGAVAVVASSVARTDGTAPSAERPRYTAAPRESVSPRDGPAAHGATDAERYASSRARPLAVHGLSLPIEGAALPSDPELLPGSPRAYRAGWHEGIDFPAPTGTAVLAVADGTIVRLDDAFTDWTAEEQARALADAVALGYTPPGTLDRLRGRQVWIDHGRGVVSRYAHLSAVQPLAVGVRVERGQAIGAVGSSGYEEGGPHLHLEVRVDDRYLGEDLTGEDLLTAVLRAFR